MQAGSNEQATSDSTKWWAMLGIGMGVLMSTLDAGIVNISLPTLVEVFNTHFAVVQWVALSFLLVITSLMLSVARLGDILGKKKVYMAGLALFTLGSLLCGLSPGVGWLIGFRALQGSGAVMMTALGTAIITEVFPASERGRALGMMGTAVSVGIAAGPMLGGVLIGLVGWRSVFLVNVPIGLLTFYIVRRVVPSSTPGDSRQRFDVTGGLIMLVTLSCYALGMTLGQNRGFGDWRVIGLLTAVGVGLTVFVFVERRVYQPMLDLKMFRNTLFSINLVMGFLVFIMTGGMFILPFFLELVQGYPTQQTGLMMTIFPLMMGTVAPVSGALSDRFGSRVISLIGLVAIASGCLLLSTLHEGLSVIGFVLLYAPVGIGMGMFQSPNNSAVMGTAPPDKLGVASGMLALTRALGQTTGIPLVGALFTTQVMATGMLPAGMDVTLAPPAALVQGLNGTLRVVAAIIFAATLLAAVALWIDRQRSRQPAVLQPQAADPPGSV